MTHRRPFAAVVLTLLLVLAAPVAVQCEGASRAQRRADEARRLVARAAQHLALRTIEGRRSAVADLEQATDLQPREPAYQLLLARAYYAGGYVREARRRFSIVASLEPGDAGAQFGLGQVWRRDWMKYVDTLSLARAALHFESCGRLDSTRVDAWTMAASMRLEMHDPVAASAAALRALQADPSSADAIVAAAAASWRLGDVEEAARGFREGVPRLPRGVRERFEDLAPLATEQDTALYNHLSAGGRREFARRFWVEHDPDLATPENEAQLEYWARVAQAYFLFWDPKHREWDERGELYVRYGPPESADFNPLGITLYNHAGGPVAFPMNVLVWRYPHLGMLVALQDRVLSEYYQLPAAKDYDPDPRPDPARVAELDAVGTHDLRGVFPSIPPRAVPVRVEGQVARFQDAYGPRLLAMLEADSSPGDSLTAQAVVLDSTGHEVARQSRPLSPSACEAERYRVADFTHELPPGRYTIGFSVRAGARRSSARAKVELLAPDTALALSDVVVTCRIPTVLGSSVRLDPNPLSRVPAGAPLVVYFEIYHLAPGEDGQSRFEYEYRVKSTDRDPRIWLQRVISPRAAAPELEASRAEENPGSMRRQFVSVPVQSLPPGGYRVDVLVRDLRTGLETTGSAAFTRLAP